MGNLQDVAAQAPTSLHHAPCCYVGPALNGGPACDYALYSKVLPTLTAHVGQHNLALGT